MEKFKMPPVAPMMEEPSPEELVDLKKKTSDALDEMRTVLQGTQEEIAHKIAVVEHLVQKMNTAADFDSALQSWMGAAGDLEGLRQMQQGLNEMFRESISAIDDINAVYVKKLH